jgi:hypothetical protein
MRRRTLLASAGTAVSIGGCLGDDGNSEPDEDESCPDPDLDDDLAYSSHEPTRLFEAADGGIVDVALLTGPDDAGRFDADLDVADESFIEETDFETGAVIGVQIGLSGDSTAPVPLGVEREGEVIRAYTCIEESGSTEDLMMYALLIRTETGSDPVETAEVVHYEDGSESRLSSE